MGSTTETLTRLPGRAGMRALAPHWPLKLQVCLSSEERVRLDEAARAAGFETVAAFVRARTLGRPSVGAGVEAEPQPAA